MRVRHLMIPGLTLRHLEDGRLPALERLGIRQRSRLVCSFPANVAGVEATLRTGRPAAEHHVLFEGDEPHSPDLLGSRHERIDLLVGGDDHGRMEQLDEALSGIEPGGLVLVSGAPSFRTCPVRIALAADGGVEMRLDGAFATAGPPAGAALPAGLRERWLETPGIERILDPVPESAGAWLAPQDRGWILVAEPGARFGSGERVAGHREPDPAALPVLVALGPGWDREWPDAVHDWRIAPTLLAAAGEELPGGLDDPLAGAASLRE